MHASHILLGRPWEYDRRSIHNGYTNQYTFSKNNRKVTLLPLSPGDVYDEQVRMKTERDKQRKEMKSSQETNEIETREPKPEAMGGSKKRSCK